MEIKVKVRCIIRNGDRVLLEERADAVSGEILYRPPGGNVEPGETSTSAAIRELREECGVELLDLRLLGVLEDICAEDPRRHLIHFVYEARVADEAFYRRATVDITEGSRMYRAQWLSLIDESESHIPHVAPPGLVELLRSTLALEPRRGGR